MLYELTTGQRPFSGDSPISILAKIINLDPTPPAQLTASVPPELDKIILRCLRKDPARRYQTMADLKVALEDIQAEPGIAARVQPLEVRRRWAWAVLLPLLVVAGYGVWRGLKPPQNAEPLRATALTTLAGVEQYPSLSPDGNHVTFTWNSPKRDNTDIYVQQIGAGSPLQLTTNAADDYSPVWSPTAAGSRFSENRGHAKVNCG